MDALVAIVTLAALLFYFWTSYGVAGARRVSGIDAPAMTGHEQLDRAVRVHTNTLEWLPIFLATLWLFDLFVPHPWGGYGATALGVMWIVGRYIYMVGYMKHPSQRSTGFLIQILACAILFLGALGGALWKLTQGG